ncbi:hypothetical protein ANN_11432 [Periplaneta americana]|uniref:Uncharacterized protein n=1 Tax=Periplaneta americana TaxID=6978 RepID=A0ABQ8T658_PERAM|nr:hypothetical protein ANN_11432 [Periplaneta americana]
MAGLCEGGNEPPGSLKATEPVSISAIKRTVMTGWEAEVVQMCICRQAQGSMPPMLIKCLVNSTAETAQEVIVP